ncbi:MAG: NAD(+)/NADH kinase [Peptococcaceae bacterium]|nr:NAD(+)/NADH kinase [Peptococcaceae bacterium]
MNKIAIFMNDQKSHAYDLAERITVFFEDHGIQVYHPHDKPGFSCVGDLDEKYFNEFSSVDMILVLGGDGTILAVTHLLIDWNLPILGINMGKMGFLAEVELEDLFSSLEEVIAGRYSIDERMMIKAEVVRKGAPIAPLYGLNDIIVNKGILARTVVIDIYVDGEFVIEYPSDGVIVSTPTGSTAYSLSAGGPIVDPNLALMVISGVCPHLLHARPLVVSGDAKVDIVFHSNAAKGVVTADGQHPFFLEDGDHIQISSFHKKAKLVRLGEKHFYDTLNHKLSERFSRRV